MQQFKRIKDIKTKHRTEDMKAYNGLGLKYIKLRTMRR